VGEGALLPPGPAPPRAATLPTPVELAVLCNGRAQLLKVAEVAKKLGVCNATVYRLCETGALPHVRVVNSIRVRPKDLAEYVTGARSRGVE
jgi:excisionase family DNA binding protein